MSFIFILLLWSNFALVFVLGKYIVAHFHFLDFVAMRMLIAGPLLVLWDGINNGRRKSLTNNLSLDILLFVAVAVLLMLIPFVLEYWSQQYLTAAKVALLHSFSPSITAALSLLLLKDHLNLNKILGLFISFIGINIAFSRDLSDFANWSFSVYELATLLAVICSCLGWVFVDKLLSNGYSSRFINGVTMSLGGIGTLIIKYFGYQNALDLGYLKIIPPFAWGVFFTILILSNFIGYPLYGWLLTSYSPTLVSLSGFLCPILTALFGYILLGEGVSWFAIVLSVLLGFVGLWVFNKKIT